MTFKSKKCIQSNMVRTYLLTLTLANWKSHLFNDITATPKFAWINFGPYSFRDNAMTHSNSAFEYRIVNVCWTESMNELRHHNDSIASVKNKQPIITLLCSYREMLSTSHVKCVPVIQCDICSAIAISVAAGWVITESTNDIRARLQSWRQWLFRYRFRAGALAIIRGWWSFRTLWTMSMMLLRHI